MPFPYPKTIVARASMAIAKDVAIARLINRRDTALPCPDCG